MQPQADMLAQLVETSPLLVSVLVFLAAATLAFGVMVLVHARGAVKRRAAGVGAAESAAPADRSLRHASLQAAQKLIDYSNRHFTGVDEGSTKELRRRLIQAGFLDARAPAFFLFGRAFVALIMAAAAFVAVPAALPDKPGIHWILIWAAGIAGYFGPNVYLGRRIAARKNEHRSGFPDFMDLLVVCADAGLSMEAALDRVGRELSDSYPSLSANVYMATLELRAGRTLSDALDHLADRLGLEEARSFATLLQQSEELGSSMTDALRVYSDEMRHKRLSTAEEKAYSLPAKLSVPLTLCVFPVVIVVILLPVYVRFKMGAY